MQSCRHLPPLTQSLMSHPKHMHCSIAYNTADRYKVNSAEPGTPCAGSYADPEMANQLSESFLVSESVSLLEHATSPFSLLHNCLFCYYSWLTLLCTLGPHLPVFEPQQAVCLICLGHVSPLLVPVRPADRRSSANCAAKQDCGLQERSSNCRQQSDRLLDSAVYSLKVQQLLSQVQRHRQAKYTELRGDGVVQTAGVSTQLTYLQHLTILLWLCATVAVSRQVACWRSSISVAEVQVLTSHKACSMHHIGVFCSDIAI